MKKSIILLFTLMLSESVFAQTLNTVTGVKLKKPITFATVKAFNDNVGAIKKGAKNGDITITLPVGSAIRNKNDVCALLEIIRNFGTFNENSAISDLAYKTDIDARLKEASGSNIYFYLHRNYKSGSGEKALGLLMGQLDVDSGYDIWNFSSGGLMPSSRFQNELLQQRQKNSRNGFGNLTDAEVDAEKARNLESGYGEFTDKQLSAQRSKNNKDGYGFVTDFERESIIAQQEALLAQQEEQKQKELEEKILANKDVVSGFIAKGNQYREKNEFCYALGSYYDAMKIEKDGNYSAEGTEKYDAFVKYLEEEISNDYGVFKLHDEWKKILENAEKYGTEYGRCSLKIGKLFRRALDYKNRTATYSFYLEVGYTQRYKDVILAIQKAYSKNYISDWSADLPSPEKWPEEYSVCGHEGEGNLIKGAAIYRSNSTSGIYNAFACKKAGGAHFHDSGNDYHWYDMILYDVKVNVVDENGNELVKPVRYLPAISIRKYEAYYHSTHGSEYSNFIDFPGITEDVMEKIDKGEAHINLVAVYLEYGKYNAGEDIADSNKVPRAFIKNFPEIQMKLENIECEYEDKTYEESQLLNDL